MFLLLRHLLFNLVRHIDQTKCPYDSSSVYCEIEVQLEIAKAAENEATETFHEMGAEICRLLQRIDLLEKTLLQYNIPVPEVED